MFFTTSPRLRDNPRSLSRNRQTLVLFRRRALGEHIGAEHRIEARVRKSTSVTRAGRISRSHSRERECRDSSHS
jgi:hypothetical protein